jgi:transposase
MYSVHDWAEVRRLHHVEGMSKSAIAAKLSMSRTTVIRLLVLEEPPKYQRAPAGSQVDRFADAIAAMLDEDPKLAATVIARRLRPLGFTGSLTILKDHLRRVRPQFVAARAYQRTSYLPGELAQVDWWHTGLRVPVGKGQSREVFGLVAGLPASAALRVVFTLARTTAEFCAALLGCLDRLGGLPAGIVLDNDAAVVASRRGGLVRLVDDAAALFGALAIKPIVLRPAFPEGKGFVERGIGYLETSLLPDLAAPDDLADLQQRADRWAATVGDRRRPRRLGGSVADALAVERAALRPLPAIWPNVDRRLEVRASGDGFVRVGDVDYSVPPRLAGRRLSVRLSLTEVVVFCEAEQVARHTRSWVRADVVLAGAHARELRLAREATAALAAGEAAHGLDVETPVLAAYDQLVS